MRRHGVITNQISRNQNDYGLKKKSIFLLTTKCKKVYTFCNLLANKVGKKSIFCFNEIDGFKIQNNAKPSMRSPYHSNFVATKKVYFFSIFWPIFREIYLIIKKV